MWKNRVRFIINEQFNSISFDLFFSLLASEGFPADLSDLNDSRPVTSDRKENSQPQTEDESTRFLPILSSTDRESPPPPTKRIYGILNLVTRSFTHRSLLI